MSTMSETEAKRVGEAIREAIMLQRVNLDAVRTMTGIIPPLDWDRVARAAIEAMREMDANCPHSHTHFYPNADTPANGVTICDDCKRITGITVTSGGCG